MRISSWPVRRLASLAVLLCLGFGIRWGIEDPMAPMSLFFFATGAFLVSGLLISRIGRAQPVGSRRILQWGVFQDIQHARQPMDDSAARSEWASLGQPDEALVGGLTCGEHCRQVLLIGETDGRRYYIYANVPAEPWAQWVVGYLFVYGRDAPFSHLPVGDDSRPATSRA
jgi:hypothetical protein